MSVVLALLLVAAVAFFLMRGRRTAAAVRNAPPGERSARVRAMVERLAEKSGDADPEAFLARLEQLPNVPASVQEALRAIESDIAAAAPSSIRTAPPPVPAPAEKHRPKRAAKPKQRATAVDSASRSRFVLEPLAASVALDPSEPLEPLRTHRPHAILAPLEPLRPPASPARSDAWRS